MALIVMLELGQFCIEIDIKNRARLRSSRRSVPIKPVYERMRQRHVRNSLDFLHREYSTSVDQRDRLRLPVGSILVRGARRKFRSAWLPGSIPCGEGTSEGAPLRPYPRPLFGAKVALRLHTQIVMRERFEPNRASCLAAANRQLRGSLPSKIPVTKRGVAAVRWLNCRVEWSERRDPERNTYFVIADNLDGQWSFFERRPQESRWYEIPVTPQRISKAEQLVKEPNP
jgi:hypothetical protein